MPKSPFTASRSQVSTYLFGVALFSISFLVFLNSAVSFVVTDLIGRKKHVGDAVGTLGFADELLALVACPVWGLLSDRVGVRAVCVLGYAIVGLSLFVFVQASNVYPQLLLARLLFSVGGAATSTMVTAVLPTMTMSKTQVRKAAANDVDDDDHDDNVGDPERSPDIERHEAGLSPNHPEMDAAPSRSSSGTSHVAGLVGMFTGLGALIALSLFLPLPARLQKNGDTPADAIKHSFYAVGTIAFMVAILCAFGLRDLPGESGKAWTSIIGIRRRSTRRSYARLLLDAAKLGFVDANIGLGYLGGFVARASSVAITLFIPLFVNAYFISSGLCKGEPTLNPGDVKEECRRAYVVASILSGVSQLVALICAPLFGYLDGKYGRYNAPLLTAALAGIIGYVALAQIHNPDPGSKTGSSAIFVVMGLLGISQIGAIVCSLSLLSRGIQEVPIAGTTSRERQHGVEGEASPLLLPPTSTSAEGESRAHLKGSIAGLYSLAGGAGILLLTKLGGKLFDSLSPGAPFYMLAIFNGILLLVGLLSTGWSRLRSRV